MPEKTQKWKPKQIIQLIKLFKERPCLWNVNVQEYRDKSKRHKELTYIAKEFNVSNEQIKKKLFNMRIQYMHERRKLQRIERETGEYCKPIWQYYDYLHFIYENNNDIEEKPKEKQFMWTHFMAKNEADEDVYESDPIEIKDDVQLDTTWTSPSPILASSPAHSSSNTSVHGQIDRTDVQFLHNNVQRDEYDIFGEYVASELRLLKDIREVQFTLKNNILKSILEANTAVQLLSKKEV